MRLVGALAAVLVAVCLVSASWSAFDFGQDPSSYAANVCDRGIDTTDAVGPGPAPRGSTSLEYQDCLNGYRSMTPIDVAGKSLLLAGGALIVAVAGFILSKDPVPETQARPDR